MTASNDDQTTNFSLPLLGRMVAHLIALSSYRFSRGALQSRNIADVLHMDESSWTKAKTGQRSISADSLGRLTGFFQLNSPEVGLTYEVFLQPDLDSFKATLEAHGFHIASDIDQIRRTILNAAFAAHTGIAIERTSHRTRSLGSPQGTAAGLRRLSVGDSVVLRIAHPGDGQLVILNDGIDTREVVCLMPSRFAPTTAVTGRSTRVPTEDGDPPSFTVNGAGGHRHRLYAFWRAGPTRLDFLKGDAANEEPRTLSHAEFQQFGNIVRAIDARIRDEEARNLDRKSAERSRVRLMIAEYQVLP